MPSRGGSAQSVYQQLQKRMAHPHQRLNMDLYDSVRMSFRTRDAFSASLHYTYEQPETYVRAVQWASRLKHACSVPRRIYRYILTHRRMHRKGWRVRRREI